MADATTEYNIKIYATGGSSAADELDKVVGATKNLKEGQVDLASTLGRRAEHVALHTLNRQILDTIGYTGNARPLISALNSTFNALARSVGLASSAMFPYIAAAGALVAIMSHLKSTHDTVKRSTDDVIKSNEEHIKSANEMIGKLDTYREYIGTLPKYLQDYEESLKKVTAQTREQTKELERAQLSQYSTQLQVAKQRLADISYELKKGTSSAFDHVGSLENMGTSTALASERASSLRKEQVALNKTTSELNAKIKALTADMIAQSKGFANAADMVEKDTEAKKKNAEATKKAAKEWTESTAKALSDAYKAYIKDADNFEKELRRKDAALRGSMGLEKAMLMGNDVAWQKMLDNVGGAAVGTYNTMMSGFGQASAEMIVSGKNFGEAMTAVWKNMQIQFIAAIIEMTARWLAFQALTGFFGPSSGIVKFMTSHATGADMLVDRPRLIQVGENGPERVSVTPITGTAGSRTTSNTTNAQTLSISVVNNISGGGNAKKIADEVGRGIINAIRGRGQLNFVRTH